MSDFTREQSAAIWQDNNIAVYNHEVFVSRQSGYAVFHETIHPIDTIPDYRDIPYHLPDLTEIPPGWKPRGRSINNRRPSWTQAARAERLAAYTAANEMKAVWKAHGLDGDI